MKLDTRNNRDFGGAMIPIFERQGELHDLSVRMGIKKGEVEKLGTSKNLSHLSA